MAVERGIDHSGLVLATLTAHVNAPARTKPENVLRKGRAEDGLAHVAGLQAHGGHLRDARVDPTVDHLLQ